MAQGLGLGVQDVGWRVKALRFRPQGIPKP